MRCVQREADPPESAPGAAAPSPRRCCNPLSLLFAPFPGYRLALLPFALQLLAGAFLFLGAVPAEAQPAAPPDLEVSSGTTLTVTWSAPSYTVSAMSVRWRVKDTDPVMMGNQAGSWIPDSVGASTLPAQRTARSIPVPPRSCSGCTPPVLGTTYEIQTLFLRAPAEGGGDTGWISAGEGTTTTQSSDATLSALTASQATSAMGTFSPLSIGAFAPATESYTASVRTSVTHVRLTPTVNESNATVKVGIGTSLAAVSSGSASDAIAISVGSNEIKVEVTAQDGTMETYTVTVTRAAAPSTLTLTASPHALPTEGINASIMLTAALDNPAPDGGTVVTITVDAGSTATATADYRLSSSTITIAAGEQQGAATLTIVDDVVAEATENVLLDAASTNPVLTATRLMVSITDIDVPGLLWDSDVAMSGVQAAPLAVVEGGMARYAFVMRSQPTGPVTVTVSNPDSGALSLDGLASGNTLTFSPGNWEMEQTVTVRALEDADGNNESVSLGHTASSSDSSYDGVSIDPLVVAVTDNDIPSVLTLGASALTPEEGETVTVTASLNNPALVDTVVTLTLSGTAAGGGTDYRLSSSTIAIAAGEREGTATIAIAGDSMADDGETIILDASNADPVLTAGQITLTIADVPPGVAPSLSALTVDAGATATYTLVLRTPPAAAVMVMLTSAAEDVATVSGVLTFSTTNWMTGQTVTVTGVGEGATSISHTASGDAEYAGLIIPDVQVTVLPEAAVDEVSRVLAPELSRLLADGAVGAVARRIAQVVERPAGGAAAAAPGTALGAAQDTVADTAARGTAAALGALVHSHAPLLSEGPLSLAGLARLLDGSEFVLPLHRAGQAGLAGQGGKAPAWLSTLTLWGGGEYRRRENDSGNLNWEADTISARVGLDARVHENWLLGVAGAWGQGTVDNPGGNDAGDLAEYRLTLGSVLPYLAWTPQEGVQLWLSGGYGQGAVRLRSAEQTVRSDAAQYLAAGGARVRLLARGRTRLHLRFEGQGVWLDIDGSRAGELSAHKARTRTLRALLEGRRPVVLSGGGVVTPSLELGVRHDGGAGDTGAAALVGGELRYQGPRGLAANAGGELLLGRSDYREWGLWGFVSWEQGPDGRGWSFRLTPRYGLGYGLGHDLGNGLSGGGGHDPGGLGGPNRLWQRGVAGLGSADALPAPAGGRLDLRIGYGLAKGRGLLAPYSELNLADEARRLRLGVQWRLGGQWDLDLSAERLERTGADTVSPGAPGRSPEHRILLEGRLRY